MTAAVHCIPSIQQVVSSCKRRAIPRQERLWIQTFNFVEMSWFRHMDAGKLITRAVVAAVGLDPMTVRNDIERSQRAQIPEAP